MADTQPEKVGRYEIVRAIGKGAMGVVYEGRDPIIGRRVAIKMCRTDVMESSNLKHELLQRFERELRAAGALQHPNIITIYDVGEHDDAPYIAMEFIEGCDLREIMAHREDYEIADLVEMMAKVCEALHAAHRHSIIHRDVKPANILLPHSGGLKVADFGIARVPDSELTLDGAIVGTPHYMSPEQFSDAPLDGRSDLFCVGIILYELLTGEKPFPGEALSTVMHHVLRREPIVPLEINTTLSPALNQVILKSLAKKPDDRYTDGKAMAAALREAVLPNPREEVLAGGPPRKAETLIGGTRPSAPEPAPESPLAASTDSTLTRLEAPNYSDDQTSYILWPAIGVGLFAALIVVALALRLQVSPQGAPNPTPATSPATQQTLVLSVWGVKTADAKLKLVAAHDLAQAKAIKAHVSPEVAAQMSPIAAHVAILDPTTRTPVTASIDVDVAGTTITPPDGKDTLLLEAEVPGYETGRVTAQKDAAGVWSAPLIVVMPEP